MTTTPALPRRRRGRQSAAAESKYQTDLAAFCRAIMEINSTLDFKISSRGWAYIFENRGVITKDELDACQSLINDCRKSGDLPLDICAIDDARAFDNLEQIDGTSPEQEAEDIVDYVHRAHLGYRPFSFWDGQEYYLQMVVEKIDLKSLFARVCGEFHIPIANAKGWADLHLRASMMRRFAEKEAEGKQCVLLYCGDHDPAGMVISDFLRSNMADLENAVGWSPVNLRIDRFGLNADFIEGHNLAWVENLITGSGVCLSNSRHPDHSKSYVQSYLDQFGARKVEANALVVAPEAGRQLCREAILKYLPDDAPRDYAGKLSLARDEVRSHVVRLIEGASA